MKTLISLVQRVRHILLIGAVLTPNIFAGESAGRAGGFLRVGLGPRAKGMGDAYTAVADNAFAPYYNAGGLGFIDHKEAGLSYSLMSFDRSSAYAGFVRKLPPTAGFGVGILQSGFRDGEARDADGVTTGESIRDVQYAAFMGFAIRYNEHFAMGIVPKLIYSKVYDVSASSVGLDVGALYKPTNRLSFGLAVHDLFQSLKYHRNATGAGEEETADRLPAVVKWGSAYHWEIAGTVTGILLVHDVEWMTGGGLIHHFGVEANLSHRVDLRIGADDGDFTTGFSLPFDLKGRSFRLDYAFILDRRQGIGHGTQDMAINFIF